MVEWMFFNLQAVKQLRDMVKQINKSLTQAEGKVEHSKQSAATSLNIAVTCSSGCVLSPCFVEKLYEHYTSSPPIDHLTVTRDHPILHYQLKGSVPLPPIWQYRQLCHKQAHFSDAHQLKEVVSSSWVDFPADMNYLLEAAFKREPLSNSTRAGELVINFHGGIAYSKSTGQRSLIRCTGRTTMFTVIAQHIEHEQYKPFTRRFQAAGILPYSVHPVSGEPIFLLGKITYSSCAWCDFGGIKSYRSIQ